MVSKTLIIGQSPAPPEPEATLPTPDTHAATATEAAAVPKPDRPALDPTRYGDWEKNGRCIDF